MTAKEWVEVNWPKIETRASVPIRASIGRDSKQTSECRYRVDLDGSNIKPENCCFIGICIPPEIYYEEMEGTNVSTIFPEDLDIYLSFKEKKRTFHVTGYPRQRAAR